MADTLLINTTPPDRAAWCAVFERSFTASEGAEEGTLIGALAGALLDTSAPADVLPSTLVREGKALGAICFTRLRFAQEPGPVWLLSPVAVLPEAWKSGVGTRLIRAALEDLRARGAHAAVTYGDPGYYGRFGFAGVEDAQVPPPQLLSMPLGWQAVALSAPALGPLTGPSKAVPAFDRPDLW